MYIHENCWYSTALQVQFYIGNTLDGILQGLGLVVNEDNLLNFMLAVVHSPVALWQPVALAQEHCVHSCCQQTCEGDPRVECEPTAM